jgi:hypothetical protein
MADISIWINNQTSLAVGSGIGFYGDSGFGSPVGIGSFQGRTFITDPSGLTNGIECNNNKLTIGVGGSLSGINGTSGVIFGQVGDGIPLRNLPNYMASLNIRFEHVEAVRTQNAAMYIYDGNVLSHDPSGLLCYCSEIIHTSTSQDNTGTGDEIWSWVHGSESLGLIDTPGTSGLRPNGDLTIDTRHDWYVAISCTPNTPNSKLFGLAVEVEYI